MTVLDLYHVSADTSKTFSVLGYSEVLPEIKTLQKKHLMADATFFPFINPGLNVSLMDLYMEYGLSLAKCWY